MNHKLVHSRLLLITTFSVLLLFSNQIKAQMTPEKLEEIEKVTHSNNGWQISAHGTVKVLLLYVEIDYDVNPSKNPSPQGSEYWKPGKLPDWADDVFDPFALKSPKATMSRYYNDCSLGNLQVLGDYWFEPIVLKESELGGVTLHSIKKGIGKHIDAYGVMLTKNNSTIESFDLWKDNKKVGTPRFAGPDEEISFDHVMLMLRNFHGLPRDNGSASGGTFGKILGHDSDTYSQFGAGAQLPQKILRHEFNHLLLGANNFHCCGGSSSAFSSYFLTTQFGWGLMGAANSSFSICNAWDRDRLGWKAKEKNHLISCLSPNTSQELSSDLDPNIPEHEGLYLLRDFATTGDALRVKVPFLSNEEFEQFIWVENHQTEAKNGIEFDEFAYYNEPGMTSSTPGLYMFMQVDKTLKNGMKAFGGDADYLRFMPADGMYDLLFTKDSVLQKWQSVASPIVFKTASMQNPLSGIQDMETIPYNNNPEDKELSADDAVGKWAERAKDGTLWHNPKFGHSRHAFTLNGNNGISMGSNPNSSNMLTYVTGPRVSENRNPKNNSTVYLNGVSVKIVEENPDGSILVNVKFNNTRIENDVRWCADTIVLNPIPNAEFAIELLEKKQIVVDHGRSPTRNTDPVLRNGEWVFVNPSTLRIKKGAKVKLNEKSNLTIDNGSSVIFQPGSELMLAKKAGIKLKNSSSLIFEKGSKLNGTIKRIKACKTCKVEFLN